MLKPVFYRVTRCKIKDFFQVRGHFFLKDVSKELGMDIQIFRHLFYTICERKFAFSRENRAEGLTLHITRALEIFLRRQIKYG